VVIFQPSVPPDAQASGYRTNTVSPLKQAGWCIKDEGNSKSGGAAG